MLRANHCSEIDDSQPTFTRKNSEIKYAEPHHLIPLSYQDSFQCSLDVQANIVSLCSNCHNQIHYGKEADKLIRELLNNRKVELDKTGLYISFQELLDLY